MKLKNILSAAFAVLTLATCSDDTGVGPGRQAGYLYFNVSEGQGWKNGNAVSRSSVEAPMRMECSLDGAPIYLHTEVTPIMSPQLAAAVSNMDSGEDAETRGIRYTDDVFTLTSGTPKISSFGVYATRTTDRGVILNYAQINPNETEGAWNKKEQEIEGVWDSGTADFYGYAPYFDNPSTDNGLSMTANGNGVPTLTYTVPTDVTKQLDILTAKHLNVSKGEDVELPYDHVMAAIKFNFKYGSIPDGTPADGGTPKDNFRWSDGLTTYDVKVTNIQITGVYKKGTWQVGEDPYDGARWTVDTSAGTGDFSYAPAKTLTGATSPVELNPDTEGNVFMMLPQTVPNDAKIQLTCELTPDGETNATKTMALSVALKETGGSTPKTWLPGYTYTYTMSLSDFAYVFDYNTATAKNYDGAGYGVNYAGTYEENVFIRSYKVDSKGNKTNVDWEPQYPDTLTNVTGVGQGGGADLINWETGSNGWIHIYDRSTGSYDTEVLANHPGANEGDTDNDKLFKIEIGTIMTPVMDLSLWNQYQTKRWKGRSTSNCYIVAGPGTYRIPLIYGNAWTKGAVNTVAYNSGLAEAGEANNILGLFRNAYDDNISSPFIKKDVEHSGHTIKDAVLIWEEGACATNGTVTEGMRHTMGGGTGGNNGTVVKVISTIDTAITGEDTYNTENGSAGTLPGCDYLQFTIDYENFNYGNAVVGIRDESNNIVWSWHIWMVNADDFIKDNVSLTIEENTITYANTNIGWVDGGQTIPAQKRTGKMRLVQKESGKIITIDAEQQKRRQFTTYFTNVLYQWGRKDPIRGNVNPADMQNDWGAPRGEAGVTSYEKADFSISAGLGIYGQKTSVGGMIMTPNKAWGLSDGDLYSKVYYNLWASKLKKVYNTNGGTWIFYGKTIYDPSPVGYCVPPSKCLTKLSRGGFAEIGSSVSLPIVCYYNSTLPFHASGVRTTTAGYDLTARGYKQPEALNAANGFYHTATPYSNDECWQLHLYFYSGTDTHNFIRGDMSECLSVKPVLWNGEAVETVEPDQDQEYLTFTFLEAGKFYWVDAHVTQTSRTIQWTRTPNDESSWQNVTSSYDGAGESLTDTHEGTKIADVVMGDKIYVRGTNATYCIKSGLTYYYNFFRTSAAYELSGNIMSLTWGSDFVGKTAFQSGSTFTFCSLFNNPQLGTDSNMSLESVDGLVMPATTLVTSCYESMFQGCKNLVSAPFLPATAGATDCYKNMYKNCSALTTVKSALVAPSSSYTDDWLDGAASSGTFFYSKTASAWPTGVDGIPSGWSSYDIYD